MILMILTLWQGIFSSSGMFNSIRDFDNFSSVCHFGGRAETEKHDPENYPWIEFQRSETIYCTI